MASTVTNRTAMEALDRLVAGKTIHCLLLTGTTTDWNTAATARDLNFASQITADEMADASYARVAATISVEEDDANDRGELHAADITFSSLSGADVVGVAFIEVVTNDADSPIRSLHDLTGAPVTPNGSDFIVRDGADGFLHAST